MRTIEASPGQHIYDALRAAEEVADAKREAVSFEFNGQTHTVEPFEGEASWKARAASVAGYPILTAEETAAEAKADLERMTRESAEAIATAKVPTEKDMRDATVPWLKTADELRDYITALAERPHDYGTCVYAMSMAAEAAKNYVAGKLGVSGFQAGAADMDFLRRARGMKHGFRLFDYANLLYPQYWDDEQRYVWQAALREPETRKRFAEEAARLLRESPNAAPRVRAHWETLAGAPAVSQSEGTEKGDQ